MDPATLPPLAQRAARGAALLDRLRPGWADEVDPDRLDLANAEGCLLGQLYGHVDDGLTALGDPDPVACGFDLEADEDDADYSPLTSCWREELWRRRAGAAR
jgi:hypothetical protein